VKESEALDFISKNLMEKWPGIDFTIVKGYDNTNAIVFIIHDYEIFFNDINFQKYAFISLPKEYLFPKNIINLSFTYQKH
jgi:hypothetical protein